jgi:hypothetical protein
VSQEDQVVRVKVPLVQQSSLHLVRVEESRAHVWHGIFWSIG